MPAIRSALGSTGAGARGALAGSADFSDDRPVAIDAINPVNAGLDSSAAAGGGAFCDGDLSEDRPAAIDAIIADRGSAEFEAEAEVEAEVEADLDAVVSTVLADGLPPPARMASSRATPPP